MLRIDFSQRFTSCHTVSRRRKMALKPYVLALGLLSLLAAVLMSGLLPQALADDRFPEAQTAKNDLGEPIVQDAFKKPVDIYLVGNRVCKKCVGRHINARQVMLTNKKGQSGIYDTTEVIGLDTHPVLRRMFLHSVHEIGLPAQIIVPQAFDVDPRFMHY